MTKIEVLTSFSYFKNQIKFDLIQKGAYKSSVKNLNEIFLYACSKKYFGMNGQRTVFGLQLALDKIIIS